MFLDRHPARISRYRVTSRAVRAAELSAIWRAQAAGTRRGETAPWGGTAQTGAVGQREVREGGPPWPSSRQDELPPVPLRCCRCSSAAQQLAPALRERRWRAVRGGRATPCSSTTTAISPADLDEAQPQRRSPSFSNHRPVMLAERTGQRRGRRPGTQGNTGRLFLSALAIVVTRFISTPAILRTVCPSMPARRS